MLTILNPITLGVMDTINDTLNSVNNSILNILFDFLDFLDGQANWMTTVAFLLIAIFILVGIFVFIKKFLKLFIVLAILGGVGYYLYTYTELLGFLKPNSAFILIARSLLENLL